MKNLTVESILNAAYLSIVKNQKFFALLTATMIVMHFSLQYFEEQLMVNNRLLLFVISLFFTVLSVKLTVMIHRSILLNEFRLESLFDWSLIEVKFIVMGLMIGLLSFGLIGVLLAIVLALLDGSFSYVLTIVAVFFGGLILCRLSLVFPSIAIQKDLTMAEAWQQSRNHVMILFLLIVGVPLLVMIMVFVLSSLFINSELMIEIISALRIVVWVYEVAILTHCYEVILVNQMDDELETTEVL